MMTRGSLPSSDGRVGGRGPFLVSFVACLCCLIFPPRAHAALPPYEEETTLLSTVPGADDGSIAATLNPAQWGILERSETAFWWSDRQASGHRRGDYG